MTVTGTASMTINEMREFANFSAAEQRYIKRSLDIGLGRQDAFKLWARNEGENAAIRSQYIAYQELKTLQEIIPHDATIHGIEAFIGKLVRVAVFDLSQDKISCFSAFRFLYERLLGADVRPWLPSAFCAASALPQIRPESRKQLLQSLSEAAATAPGWSDREPAFYPEYIEAAEAA
ncbi:MAG: hypothetical protein DCO98_02260 [Altererythrobacter sp. XM-24bin4]|uniref:hypothetical protein n=1 Tax=uncultured Altererythrobacter sp. TaxID=500840 RepID=UPI000D7B6A89|nr:hypothetical protein [uncultured Altererythrobacter sp.]PWL25199.1 MAG: hypothetical protein DCO98_02260 [Altererythrobacter sp. XM-24bin4]